MNDRKQQIIDTDYMKVAEELYRHVNPNSKMDVPNSAYITTKNFYTEWANSDTDLSLFDWCLKNKN